MRSTMMNLLPVEEIKERGVRLLGGTMSNFQVENEELPLQLKIDFDWGDL